MPQNQQSDKKIAQQNQLFNTYMAQTAEDVAAALKTSLTEGLNSQEAQERKKQYGPNTLREETKTWVHILWKQVTSPFIYILIIIAIITFILGEWMDGLMIIAIVVINTLFSFYQEYRIYHALQILKKYITYTSRVIRNGTEIEIDASDIVPGDIITLRAGDRIPADIRFIKIDTLAVDESILTGESAPVQKTTDVVQQQSSLFHAANIGFGGTMISSGSGMGVVFATGEHTYFGSIAELAQKNQQVSSFTLGLARFSKFILFLIVITIAIMFTVHFFFNKQLSTLNLIIFSLALGISIIPEALPIVTVFSLARGALHLTRYKVIAKRLSSIEDLGSMQILCVDKTGTLTESILTLSNVYGEDKQKTLLYGILASGLSPEQLATDKGFNGPLWQQLSDAYKKKVKEYAKQAEHPFEAQLRYNSMVVCHNNTCELIVRGTVYETLELCTGLTEQQKQEIISWTQQESAQAHRVLLIAAKEIPATTQTITNADEQGVHFIGLLSYDDPLKPTAAASLERAHNLGVTIKIMSGDMKEVNLAVAQKIKLITDEKQIITGEEFAKLSDAEKQAAAERYTIFARVIPSQKVEIIKLLEKKYDTGYLGDGINDAPALKAAHVSMAVNTAVDVARDVADIILLRKSLRVIVDGIHEGRVIFANIIKYIKSTLTPNFGHFYSLAILSLFINFLPLLPVHLLLISLLTDFPLIAISTDTVPINDINRPQQYNLKEIGLITMFLGMIVMIADFSIFALFYKTSPSVLQTNWFIASILIELSFFYSIRTKQPFYRASRPSLIVMILSFLVAAITVALPFTNIGTSLLHFSQPTMTQLLAIGLVVCGYFIITDLIKVIFYRNFFLVNKNH